MEATATPGASGSGGLHKNILFGVSGRKAGGAGGNSTGASQFSGEHSARRRTFPEHELLVVPRQGRAGTWAIGDDTHRQQRLSDHAVRLYERDAIQVRRDESGHVSRSGYWTGWHSDAFV